MKALALLVFFAISCNFSLFAQIYPAKDWHLKSVEDDEKTAGIAANRAYELVKNREAKPVIIAILDSGIDTTHEDLKAALWVNEDEIPDNGIDDDGNGFIDDIHGWNFLGGDSATVNYENLEVVRLYRSLKNKRSLGETLSEEEVDLLAKYKQETIREQQKAKQQYENAMQLVEFYSFSDATMQQYFGKSRYTLAEVKSAMPETDIEEAAIDFLTTVFKDTIDASELIDYAAEKTIRYKYNTNIDYNPRNIVGDDPANRSDSIYGNNDLMGLESSHGTHVAGIAAAIRNNGIGIDGVAPNVKIMVVRTVPLGDEYDKDVANAILYAVRNGAQVINMSFGKNYSPNREFVSRAIAVAESKGVIMVHGAGNDAANKDVVLNYPKNERGKESPFWFEIGSHTNELGKTYPSDFSNYGENTIDLFAPGTDIYSTIPVTNTYAFKSGTSMAAPVVTGAIGFLLSYFPELQTADIKKILEDTANDYSELKVYMPFIGADNGSKAKFKTLCAGGKSLNLEATTKLLLNEGK